MRICMLGECSGNLDEGMRNVIFHLTKELSKHHQILPLDLGSVFSKAFWRNIQNSNPQIIHYIHGLTFRSFILLKTISLYSRDAKTVMFATRPYFPSLATRLIPLFKPDLILTQSYETEGMFRKLGCKTEFMPCGVDVERFNPSIARATSKLREKYGVSNEKFIILHVGSLKKGRNVEFLRKLQKGNNQVVIVAATSSRIDQELRQQLEKSGCLVWARYFEHIEEIYALSDCYLFPTVPKMDLMGRSASDSIEMPLSVLEAMACNLPVVSTRFKALPRIFEEGEGLIYADKERDFVEALERIKNGIRVRNREKVLHYSWINIAERLQQIYADLVSESERGN